MLKLWFSIVRLPHIVNPFLLICSQYSVIPTIPVFRTLTSFSHIEFCFWAGSASPRGTGRCTRQHTLSFRLFNSRPSRHSRWKAWMLIPLYPKQNTSQIGTSIKHLARSPFCQSHVLIQAATSWSNPSFMLEMDTFNISKMLCHISYKFSAKFMTSLSVCSHGLWFPFCDFIFHPSQTLLPSIALAARICWPFRLLRLWQWTYLVGQCAVLRGEELPGDTSYSARGFPNPSRDFCFVTDYINGRRHWWIFFLTRSGLCLFTLKSGTSIRKLTR